MVASLVPGGRATTPERARCTTFATADGRSCVGHHSRVKVQYRGGQSIARADGNVARCRARTWTETVNTPQSRRLRLTTRRIISYKARESRAVRCILVSLSSNILREIPTTLGEDGRHESTFPRVAPAVKSTWIRPFVWRKGSRPRAMWSEPFSLSHSAGCGNCQTSPNVRCRRES